jgi:hypothetical protein
MGNEMKNKLSDKIPKRLIPFLNKTPNYFLPDYQVKINDEIYNSTVHIKINEENRKKAERISKKVFNILKTYTPNIEKEENEILGNLITFFRMELEDLAELTVQCGRDLKKVKNIYIGLHMGKMLTKVHPDGFGFPIFEGDQLKIGMIMADIAEKVGKSIISTEEIYKYASKKGFKKMNDLKLKNGKTMTIYEID